MTTATDLALGSESAAVGKPRRPRGPRQHYAKVGLTPLWLLTPAGLVIVALVGAPIVYLIITSFTDSNAFTLNTGQFNWVGLKQYTTTFANVDFWWALVRTVLFTAAMVGGSVLIGMAVAQMLTRLGTVIRYIVTVVLILAWAMPNVASSQVWKWLFEPGFGVINWLVTQTHLFGNTLDVNWPQNSSLAFLCIWLLIVWQAVPFIALTVYAAQTQVSPDYVEAARLDGASEWRIYWSVMLPFLRPTVMLMTILSIIWDFNVFNQIWLISQGGPNDATNTLGVYTYTQAFVSNNFGGGAAISIITTILLMLFTSFYIRSLLRSGEDL